MQTVGEGGAFPSLWWLLQVHLHSTQHAVYLIMRTNSCQARNLTSQRRVSH